MASDGGHVQQVSGLQDKNISVFFSFVPIFVLAFALISVVIEYGVGRTNLDHSDQLGPLFLSKLTLLYIISLT